MKPAQQQLLLVRVGTSWFPLCTTTLADLSFKVNTVDKVHSRCGLVQLIVGFEHALSSSCVSGKRPKLSVSSDDVYVRPSHTRLPSLRRHLWESTIFSSHTSFIYSKRNGAFYVVPSLGRCILALARERIRA